MEILILTGKFGMGHWSAARSLREQLERDGHSAHVIDFFTYARPELAPSMYRWFNLLVTYGGGIYNVWHRMTRNAVGEARVARPLLRGMDALLAETRPDLVLSTHPICSGVVSRWREEHGSGMPLVTCITDVICHNEWLHPGTGCYLVASDAVRDGLVERGVDPERVEVTGIPVGARFEGRSHRREGPRELLIMGGGLGLMPRRDSFYEALSSLPDLHITILTGKNDKLYQHLRGRWANIEAVPFTDRVYEYMGRADLMLSKPGGITMFEAIAARLPMLAWEPFLDQERENAKFLTANGMARIAAKEESACLAAIRETIYNDELLAGMERAMDSMAGALRRTAVCAVVRALAREEVCA